MSDVQKPIHITSENRDQRVADAIHVITHCWADWEHEAAESDDQIAFLEDQISAVLIGMVSDDDA